MSQGTFGDEGRLDTMPSKKKPLATKPSLATAAPPRPIGPIAPEARSPRSFPTALDAFRSPDIAAIVRAAVRAAACAGAVVSSAAVLGGCHEPECAASRVEELELHGGDAVDAALDLRFRESMDQLGYGTGLTSHPPYLSMPLAGAMMPVLSTPLPEETPPEDVDPDPNNGVDRDTDSEDAADSAK